MRVTIHEALKVLEINVPLQELDQETLKKQYKKMARKYHPDINKSDDAEEMFKKVNESKDILEKAINSKNNQSSLFGMFRDFFSYTSTKNNISPIIINISLNLREQYYGGDKEIKYKRRVICKSCNGKGCAICHDQGFTINEEKVKVNLQPGLTPDAKLVFKESGHEYIMPANMSNQNIVIAGDVVLQVNLDKYWNKSDTIKFERNGSDLIIHNKIRYIDFIKQQNSDQDKFEVELFDKGDTVVFTNQDTRINGFMILKQNLGFKPDYRSMRRGNLVYVYDVDWTLEESDPAILKDIIKNKNKN